MLNPDKLRPKHADPSAKGKGRAGVLPEMPDAEKDAAFALLDEAMGQQMDHDYQHGRERGQTTNNKYLDPYFTWMPGYTNIITGWGSHGKSQFMFEQLLTRAVYDDKKSVVWPSENLPAQRFYDNLIHTLTGRSVDRRVANCLTLAEYRRAREFIRAHFFALDVPTGHSYTPAHLLGYFERAIARFGVEHCMIDPWNKADHTAKAKQFGSNDEAYIGHTLGLCTKWSQDTRQCLVITAHPKRADEGMGYRQMRPVPNGGSISGGQMWENMAHYIGAVHRPFADDERSTAAAFYCQKSKDERLVARRGTVGGRPRTGEEPDVPLNWGSVTNRYLWGNEGYSPLANAEFAPIWEVASAVAPAALFVPPPAAAPVVAPALAPNHDFDALPADRDPRTGARLISSSTLRP